MRYKRKQNTARRRAEAIARKEARDNRTPEQQLEIVQLRPGQSVKETSRLLRQIGAR